MELITTIVVSLFGSAGFFSLLQFLINRYDGKRATIARIEEKIDHIESKTDRNELAITRLQLIFLIKSQPKNKDAILQTAQRYFIELDGDGEAWAIFDGWATKNELNTGWYKALLKREKGKK